jgi:hypothetical protein
MLVLGGGLVEKDQPRRIKQALLAYLTPARTRHVRSLLLGGVQAFFNGEITATEETPHNTATTGNAAFFAAMTSSSVKSGWAAIRSKQDSL